MAFVKLTVFFRGSVFSRNFFMASECHFFLAGMLTARQYADMVVTIDADFTAGHLKRFDEFFFYLNATETAVK